MTTKFLTYTLFEQLNKKAIKNRLNRSVYFDKLPIDKNDRFPVSLSFLHNDKEIRCEVVLNRDGDTAWLDMSFNDYNGLPEVE
jgi:hypothetical protein